MIMFLSPCSLPRLLFERQKSLEVSSQQLLTAWVAGLFQSAKFSHQLYQTPAATPALPAPNV